MACSRLNKETVRRRRKGDALCDDMFGKILTCYKSQEFRPANDLAEQGDSRESGMRFLGEVSAGRENDATIYSTMPCKMP